MPILPTLETDLLLTLDAGRLVAFDWHLHKSHAARPWTPFLALVLSNNDVFFYFLELFYLSLTTQFLDLFQTESLFAVFSAIHAGYINRPPT